MRTIANATKQQKQLHPPYHYQGVMTQQMEYRLPTVTPKWKRTFHSIDIQPVERDSSQRSSSVSICTTCNQNEARYTCPKCRAQYCSVACYKVHDIPGGTSHEGGGRCTETFYRDKVKEVTDLFVRDENNIGQMRGILTRSYYNDDNSTGGACSENCKEKNSKTALTDEDFIELVNCGFHLDDDTHGLDDEELDFESLPSHIQSKFEEAVQRGELSHILQKRNPFWLSSYEENTIQIDDTLPSLDERISTIPAIFTIESKVPKVQLENNICEVLFVAAWTFRLHNSFEMVYPKNYVSENSLDAALFLQGESQVLAHDARYENIQHVLMDCSQRTRRDMVGLIGLSDDSVRISPMTLANDLLCICRHRRMTLKVLFYAIDLMDSAGNKSKEKVDKRAKGLRKILRLTKKKLQYYLSWCQVYWDTCSEDVVTAVEEWIQDWDALEDEAQCAKDMSLLEKAKHAKNRNTNNKTQNVKLSISNVQDTHESPLLVPVQTKKL